MSRRGTATRYAGAGKRRAKRSSWPRRHKALSLVLACLTVLVVGCGGYLVILNNKFGNIDRFGLTLSEDKRPDPATGKALNILLLGADAEGSDNHNSSSIAQDLAKPTWPSGSHRSDTIIVMHISADRKHVYLVSLPRDTYVDIYDASGEDKGKNKINAAFSYYGPSGALATVENLTHLRMNHLAIIDWNGFKDLSKAVGGVRVYVPKTFHDDSQDVTWHKGWHTLEGDKALAYVRTRHGLSNGDFGRIQRQQNFIRSLMKKFLSNGTMNNPLKLNSALEALTRNLTVDKGFSNGDIRGLALAMRNINADDVEFVTAPTAGYGTAPNGTSIVKYDAAAGKKLFNALSSDQKVKRYLKHHPDAKLDGSEKVN